MSGTRWLAEYVDRGDLLFRIGREGDHVVAEWLGLATLVARRDGSASRLDVVEGADPREVEKIERGSARLLLRQLAGQLSIHGAAVAHGGESIVVLGRSGEGKSTLAAWLCVHAEATLFADDAVALDEASTSPDARSWLVHAVERDHWLDDAARTAIALSAPKDLSRQGSSSPVADRPNNAEGKWPMRSVRPGAGASRLAAFVELAYSEVSSPRLTQLRGVDALAALVPQAVRFVLDEPALQRRELDTLAALVEAVPVFRLERRRDLTFLDASGRLAADLLCCNDRRTGSP